MWRFPIVLFAILPAGLGINIRQNIKDVRPRFCRAIGECFDYTSDLPYANMNNASSDLKPPSPDENSLQCEDLNYAGRVNHSSLSPTMASCLNDRLVPTFIVLGAQKSATTNFAQKFLNVALSIVPPKPASGDPSFFWKELHVFDRKDRFDQLGVNGWLQYFPKCPETHYAVGMDATPSYLPTAEAPKRMVSWYGQFKNRVNFLVILRKPLPRMRSSFYHMKDVAKAMKRDISSSFAHYLSGALRNYEQGCPSGRQYSTSAALKECKDPAELDFTGDPFYLSLYVRQLEAWFKEFAPNQFVISGMLSYVAPTKGMPFLVDFMAARLGSSVKTGVDSAAIPKSNPKAGNTHKYPSFEEELASLTKAEREQVDFVMDQEAGADAMARLLAPAMKRGLTLFGYPGDPSDKVESIGKFIADSW